MQEFFKKQLTTSKSAKHWQKIGIYPHHGMIIMLSSIKTKTSPLCGEFLDLIPLIHWCKSLKMDFLQLLPINDTGFDNSPYNPTSTLALNPIYLSLHALPYSNESKELQKKLDRLKAQKPEKKFNYSKTRALKFDFLESYYQHCFSKIKSLKKFKQFFENNPWVERYGLFLSLCELYKAPDWQTWPKNMHSYSTKQMKPLIEKHRCRIDFYIMIQFLCFSQLSEVKKVADRHQFFLMGDLPFLVSRSSFDVWDQPNLFLLNVSVGSPPDDLTKEGQNWNFPAYHWENLRKSNYSWWKMRLKCAENYFHIYRLDHVIGFFRTWNIPKDKEGKDGSFNPEDPAVWLNHGADFLSALLLGSTMLPIGEDLVIPQTIKDVLRELGICGTNILLWQRTGAGGTDFVPAPLYTPATITHVASHDTVTLEQWWNKYPKVAKLYCLWKKWPYTPSLTQDKRRAILKESHQTSSLFHANLLQEYLALFPEMVHKNYHDERINYPGTPSYRNWRYRCVLPLEKLMSSKKLYDAIYSIINLS